MKRNLLLLSAIVISVVHLMAYDFQANGIYYNITSSTNHEVAVTNASASEFHKYFGDLIIPSSVSSSGITYSVTSIESKAFYIAYIVSLFIPYSIDSIGASAFACCQGLSAINVDINSQYFICVNGVLYSKDKSEILWCVMNKRGELEIPNTVKKIYGGTFDNCVGFTCITIPESTTEIGDKAFNYCSGLTSIHTKSITPINLSSSPDIFTGVHLATCVLYVPKDCKSAYQNAAQWSSFKNIREEGETEIQTVSANELGIRLKGNMIQFSNLPLGEIVSVYTTDGKIVFNQKATEQSLLIQLQTNKTYIIKIGMRSTKILL